MVRVAHGRHGVRNKLYPDRYMSVQHQNSGDWLDRLELPPFVIGRFVLDKHCDQDGRPKQSYDKYSSSAIGAGEPHRLVVFSRELEELNPEGGIVVEPKQLILRYLTEEMLRRRYNTYARENGFTNTTRRHHTNNMRAIKKDITAAFSEVMVQDAQNNNLLLEQKAVASQQAKEARQMARETRQIDRLSSVYNDDFELIPALIEDPGAYDQEGPVTMKLRKRLAAGDEQVALMLSTENLHNLAIVKHDLARINHALKLTGLVSEKHGLVRLDEMPLDVPVFTFTSLEEGESAPRFHTPITPAEAVSFQPLGVHEIQ